jgi:zinc metalloprotease ZmpB
LEHLHHSEASTAYVRSIADKLNIAPEAMRSLDQPVSYLDPKQQSVEYRLSEKKELFDSVTYAYYQTYLNAPVWTAGITVTVNQAPARIVGATNTSEHGINAKLPSSEAIERYRRLFATGEKVDGPPSQPKKGEQPKTSPVASDLLAEIIGKAAKPSKGSYDERPTLALIRGRFFVYRYDPEKRTEDHPQPMPSTPVPEQGLVQPPDQPLSGPPPTLPLPPCPNRYRTDTGISWPSLLSGSRRKAVR